MENTKSKSNNRPIRTKSYKNTTKTGSKTSTTVTSSHLIAKRNSTAHSAECSNDLLVLNSKNEKSHKSNRKSESDTSFAMSQTESYLHEKETGPRTNSRIKAKTEDVNIDSNETQRAMVKFDTDGDSHESEGDDSDSDDINEEISLKLMLDKAFCGMSETGQYVPEVDLSDLDLFWPILFGDLDAFQNFISSKHSVKDEGEALATLSMSAIWNCDLLLLQAVLSHLDKELYDNKNLVLQSALRSPIRRILAKNNFFVVENMLKIPHLVYFLLQQSGNSIESLLHNAVRMGCCREILTALESLLENSYSPLGLSPDLPVKRILQFYASYTHGSGAPNEIEEAMACALKFGIDRHVHMLLPSIDVQSFMKSYPASILFIAKYIRNASYPDSGDIFQKHVTQDKLRSLNNWYSDLDFISTALTRTFELQTNSTKSSDETIDTILTLIDNKSEERHIVMNSVTGLLDRLFHENDHDGTTLTPILVGSASENTRSFFPDEFDVLTLFTLGNKTGYDEDEFLAELNSEDSKQRKELYSIILEYFREAIQNEMKNQQQDSCLVIEDTVNLLEHSAFPCLVVWWRGDVYKNMKIKIDLIPTFPYAKQFPIPDHKYYPHERHCRITVKRGDTKQNISFSEIENGILRNLPSNIRNGYILAKAIRNMHLLAPVLQRLFDLGVVDDIDDVIRSYMLKTCVLFLTQNLDQHDKQIQHGRFYWAIRIYQVLRDFISNGCIPHFFLSSSNSKGDADLFACKQWHHGLETLKYRCCRKRAAMLDIVDRLLDVLKSYCTLMNAQSRYTTVRSLQTGDSEENSINVHVAPLPIVAPQLKLAIKPDVPKKPTVARRNVAPHPFMVLKPNANPKPNAVLKPSGESKPSVGPKTNTNTKPILVPKQNVEPKPNVESSSNVGPRPNVEPRQNMGPKPNVGPKPTVEPKPNVESRSNVEPRPSADPRQNAGPKPNEGPKPNVGHKPNVAPKPNVEPKTNMVPRPNVGPERNVVPMANLGPKPNVEPKSNMVPRPNVGPERNVEPVVDLEPKPNAGPKSNVEPKSYMVPRPNVGSERNVGPMTNLGPKPNMGTKLNVEPRPNVRPKPYVGPKPNVWPKSNAGPKPNVEPKPSTVPRPNVGREPNVVPKPKVESKPKLGLTSYEN